MKATETKPWLKHYDPEKLKLQMPDLMIMDYLLWRNADNVNVVSLSYYDNEITFAEMYANICKTANAYASLGVKDGDVVVVVSATTPEIVYTFYALSMIGAIPDIIDPRYNPDGIRHFIDEAGAKLVLTLDVAYEKVIEAIPGSTVEKVIVLSPSESLPQPLKFLYGLKNPLKKDMPEGFMHWHDFVEQGKNFEVEYLHTGTDRCCVIVHTGGTTGMAKSVMLSHKNINNVHFQYRKSHMTSSYGKDKFLNVMPAFISYGLGYGVHLPLSSKMTSVIIPQLEPENLAKLLLKYKPADIAGTPAHMQVMIKDKRLKNADLSFFKNCCCGGDSIAVPIEEEVNAFLKAHGAPYPLTKGYGMTELSAVSTACMLNFNRLGSVGIPHADFLIAAFDPETGEELEIGQEGEICIHGPTMMLGYYKNQAETDHIIRTHADGLKWVHTGDLGYMDEDGYVFIKGRLKRMIINHDGFKIFPTALENVITKHEWVETCSVVGTKAVKHFRGQTPYAFVKLKDGCPKSEAEIEKELRELCLKDLPEYMQPEYYRFVKELEYTPIGKVDTKKLEAMALEDVTSTVTA